MSRRQPVGPETTYTGTVPQPLDQMRLELDRTAVQQGWVVGPASTREQAVLVRGMSASSFGTTLYVQLVPDAAGTRLVFHPREAVPSLFDWGRNKRKVQRLLVALGGTLDGTRGA
ncbi:hypothetical protein KIN34_05510 [Cellulomonas sp. DKR-3]|uniref:DUF1499 domain-containing protein n=1 Tax=Cellulomonas fulva TaxID=2835530 RepID=A0ABS5TXB0_9CELL|nr:hypothetical protein [Cellulomonas fulva]MBT0993741.1 hypothetical protein [Cellulomonas fulva]